jgi:predicted DNA-binding antitoxin AbrB/MazE fold protein
MVRQLDAIYEDGVLRPLEPLELGEHQRVRITVDDTKTGDPASAPAGIRATWAEEREWLATEGKRYSGEWVALVGTRLLASGPDAALVWEAALATGAERPLLVHVAKDRDMPFGGW